MSKKKKKEKKIWARTNMPDGISKLIRVCEDLRERNTDGYIKKSLWLASVKPFGFGKRITKATVCSPFTGTVIGVAFDPTYPRDDLGKDPYVPKANGGTEDLPYAFYAMHNNDGKPVESLVEYGIGEKIDMKQMRRGDMLAIDWAGGGGHAVFCWDVHLNDQREVDCFQMIGSHGSLKANGYGVHIHGCSVPTWLTGKPAAYDQPGTGNLAKAKDKIFEDDIEIVRQGTWFALPGVKYKQIDLTTFRVTPNAISAPGSKWRGSRVGALKVGRFFYEGSAPEPFCMKDGPAAPAPSAPRPSPPAASSPPASSPPAKGGAAPPPGGGAPASGGPAPPPPQPGHITAPVTPVKKAEVKKDPEAVKKVEPKPAKQDPHKPLMMQRDVELALRQFYDAKWIDKDPGIADDIYDAKSKEAIKAFQRLFKLDDDGIVGKKTFAMLMKQLPAVHVQEQSEDCLVRLFRAGKLSKDPGAPNGENDGETRDAVKEFQQVTGLEPNGVPDADTAAKLKSEVEKLKPTSDRSGGDPRLEAVYWLGNQIAPGGKAKLRLHSEDLKIGQVLSVTLKDAKSGKSVESATKLVASAPVSEVAVAIPPDFSAGSLVLASIGAALEGGKKLALDAIAPLYVRPAAAGGAIEEFFKLKGKAGEGARERDYTYVAYKVHGKAAAWFMRCRFMTDLDGAPNCYHPDDKNVRTDYMNFDLESHTGALDWKRNGGHPGNWFGVVTDTGEKDGTPIIQGKDDPFPGFYVSSSSLVDRTKKRGDPRRYVDARVIPYLAFNYQVYAASGSRFEQVTAGATGRLGDLITVVNPNADEAHRYYHAIFADVGGRNSPHFGEGSPALGKRIRAHGLAEPSLLCIVYPHSGADQGTIPTNDEIQSKAEKLFNDWGGMNEVNRVLGLMPK